MPKLASTSPKKVNEDWLWQICILVLHSPLEDDCVVQITQACCCHVFLMQSCSPDFEELLDRIITRAFKDDDGNANSGIRTPPRPPLWAQEH